MMRALMTKTLFVLSILLSAQALAFDVGGLSYTVIPKTTNVEVIGRATGNSDADIVIPDSVIGNNFIPYSVTTIGGFAFQNNALTSVTIGNSVTTIGERAFQGNALTSVIIPDSVTTIGVEAFRDNDLTSVTIGNSVTSIGAYAFANNTLTSVTIGNSVTTIGERAFANNILTSVIIPDSVTTIGNVAFSQNALTSAAFEGNFGTFSLNMFVFNLNLATITYCEGTTGWPQGFNTGLLGSVTAIEVNCVLLQIDIADPDVTKFIATGANALINNNEYDSSDGFTLLDVFAVNNGYNASMGGGLSPPSPGVATYDFIDSYDDQYGYPYSINIYKSGGQPQQEFSTSSPAFSGEGTVANFTDEVTLNAVGSKGNIVAGHEADNVSGVIGQWEIIDSSGDPAMGLLIWLLYEAAESASP